MKISGWGRYPVIETQNVVPLGVDSIMRCLRHRFNGIVRGMGRSYGDSSLAETMIQTDHLNHLLEFDPSTGVVLCEGGVSLADLLEVFVPKGWFLPVTPGTKFVSVGGAIACDVHGKNHHSEGAFSDHVLSLSLLLADGSIVTCSTSHNEDLFHATCGGMGLTGIILQASIALKPIKSAYINETLIKAKNLGEILELFEEQMHYTYSVAWIDCLATGKKLGRSLLMLGEHAEEGDKKVLQKRPLSVPFDMPSFLLNRYSISTFNALFYHKVWRKQTVRKMHYDPFFYPLDGILKWNRLYGKNGFLQYQFVIPKEEGQKGLERVLTEIAKSKRGSFLAVVKVFGKGNENYLSFPMEGYTLALDFKLERGLLPFLQKLDQIVLDLGGRLYLTKDACMKEETFKQSYPNIEKFAQVREKYGANKVFHSLQSKRLGL